MNAQQLLRPRGVTLTLLDLTQVIEDANTWWTSEHQDGSWVEVGYAPYAAAEHNGDLYVVSNEGVGWKITDTSHLILDLYRKSPNGFGILPAMEASLTPDEVRACMTGEDIDLADLIRVFGRRLEDNFNTWFATLNRPAYDGQR